MDPADMMEPGNKATNLLQLEGNKIPSLTIGPWDFNPSKKNLICLSNINLAEKNTTFYICNNSLLYLIDALGDVNILLHCHVFLLG